MVSRDMMIKIIAVNLDDTLEKSKFEKLMSYISIQKRDRINRLHRHEDAQRTLIGDILIRYLLCERMKIKNQNLIFGVNEYGKPFLTNFNDIQYNISHSGKWVTCLVDNLPVGIDVEQIKPIDINIAERFFSKEEIKSLLSKNIIDRVDYFYDLWTLKESYIKAVGKGLSILLNSFSIRICDGNFTVSSTHELNDYYFRQYYIDKDYKVAVCSIKNEFPNEILIIDVNDLYEKALLL